HRVLAVEADARAYGRLAVDVLVRIDHDPVRRAELSPERVELLPQLRVAVVPGVPRQASVPCGPLRLGKPVAERRRHDAPGSREQALRVTRDLRLRHREAHPPEEPACPPAADVPLGRLVRLCARDADRVERELLAELDHLGRVHRRILPGGMMGQCRPRPTRTSSSAPPPSAASSAASCSAATPSPPTWASRRSATTSSCS